MTTRRSRLKAVANLAVRRKPLLSQGSTHEETSSENPGSEKVLAPNSDKNIAVEKFQKNKPEKIIDDNTVIESDKNETALNVTSGDFNNFISEKTLFNNESSNLIGEANNLNKCNLTRDRTGCFNNQVLGSNKQFKQKEKYQVQNFENSQESQVLDNLKFNVQCDDGKIVKEGSKSYAVLTPKNAIDYILPIAPAINPCALTNLNHVYASEEFEVQFYTEIYSENIYNSNNSIDVNGDVDCESVDEPDAAEPLLKNLFSCNIEKEINNENINNYSESDTYTELKNVSNDVLAKSALKSTAYNKSCTSGSDKFYRSSASHIKDANLSSNPMNMGTQNFFPDLQNVSQFRRKRSKYNDFTKKLADAKREFQRKYEKTKPDRSTLKMIDLIFYNPVTNPMESKNKFEKKEMVTSQSELIQNLLAEESTDDPEAMDCDSESHSCDGNEIQGGNSLPVPQVKIGINGEIILDEKSLVIETTDAKKGRENLQNTLPIFEDKGSKVSYYGGKSKKSKDWADFETKRFYKALNTIGPDFTLMQKYFPKRSRLELKNKFKREERLNKNLIDKALNNPSEFDMTQLEKDLDVERKAEEEIEMRLCSMPKQTPKKSKTKSSFLSREMMDSVSEPKENQSNAERINVKNLSENEKNKKKKEFDFVFQKLLAKESAKRLNGFPKIPT